MTNVVYFSKTGNVKRFINKLGSTIRTMSPYEYNGEEFILVTYTSGMGEIPKDVRDFLNVNGGKMIGVAGSGNKNWGSFFALSAENIAEEYKVPYMKFEMSGTQSDVVEFYKFVHYIRGVEFE